MLTSWLDVLTLRGVMLSWPKLVGVVYDWGDESHVMAEVRFSRPENPPHTLLPRQTGEGQLFHWFYEGLAYISRHAWRLHPERSEVFILARDSMNDPPIFVSVPEPDCVLSANIILAIVPAREVERVKKTGVRIITRDEVLKENHR